MPSEVAGGNGLDVVRATQKKKKKKQRLKGVTSAWERAIGKAAKRGGEVLTTKDYATRKQGHHALALAMC